MPFQTLGVHHVTAIAGEAQANLDFYAGVLGLRLVKRTVNFDDPATYHFYFGDATGQPGSLLTFFPWAGMPRGRPGPGQVTRVSFSVPAVSLPWWERRLAERGVAAVRADERTLTFEDPDGLALALVADDAGRPATLDGAWLGGVVPAEHVPRGLHGVTIEVARAERTIELLSAALGFRRASGNGTSHVLDTPAGGRGSRVEVLERPGSPPGRMGAGTVHHVAWRARGDAEQNAWREALGQRGLMVTPVQDRCYFRSIYFREPGGVLYEIATDPPGFTIDESAAELGGSLKLPPWLESGRRSIERSLPPIRLPHEARVS